jgi:hypothetical protein
LPALKQFTAVLPPCAGCSALDQIKNLEWEAEVLTQRFAAVQAERDALYDKFEASVYDVAQKTGQQFGELSGMPHISSY